MKYLTRKVLTAEENPLDVLENMGREICGEYVYFEEIAMAHFRRIADSFAFEGDRWLFGFERGNTVAVFLKVGKGWWQLIELNTDKCIYFTNPEFELNETICLMYK